MSTTSTPDTAPAPAVRQPERKRGLGSLRSLIISMVVIMVAVLAWRAMVPRVREISQPAVDVASVARQVRQETGWAISQPVLPAGWKATNVRFETTAEGVKTWHAGYLSPDGQYLSIDQTAAAGASDSWISARTSDGRSEGTLAAAGKTWLKLSAAGLVQRSIVSKGDVAPGVTTVLSGTAPYSQLAQFAEALKPVPAG